MPADDPSASPSLHVTTDACPRGNLKPRALRIRQPTLLFPMTTPSHIRRYNSNPRVPRLHTPTQGSFLTKKLANMPSTLGHARHSS